MQHNARHRDCKVILSMRKDQKHIAIRMVPSGEDLRSEF